MRNADDGVEADESILKPRILLVAEQSVPSRYLFGAMSLLRDRGLDSALATLNPRGPLHEALETAGLANFSLNSSSSRSYPAATIRLARLVRGFRCDVVHALEPICASISGFSALLFKWRALTLYHRHHCVGTGIQASLSKAASRLCDFTMACSEASALAARKVDRAPGDRVLVAYNGIPALRSVGTDETAGIRSRLGISDDAKIIVMVSRLREEKGHIDLLCAVPLIKAALSNPLHIIFAGRGPADEAIRDHVRFHQMKNVRMVGHTEDVAPWLALADVIAMPSHSEPFGLAAVEAMAARRPLVAAGVEGLLEVVEDGVSGLVVPPRKIEQLANALLRVLQDRRLAMSLAEGGYSRFVERFTDGQMVNRWIESYRMALDSYVGKRQA